MDDFERELKLGFLDEAAQSLTDTEQCFLLLESDASDAENLNKIFRLAHNLKGSSKAVGFDQMGAFTHEFETFILKIKNGDLKASAAVVSLLLRCNDYLIKMVEELKSDLGAQFDFADLLAEMSNLQNGQETPPIVEISPSIETEPEPQSEPEPQPEPQLQAQPQFEVQPDPEPEISPVLETQIVESARPVPAPIQKEEPKREAVVSSASLKTSAQEETIRISLSKLEMLLNFVGEMTILQSVMREQATLSASPLLKRSVQQLGKVGKEIQDIAMSLRMVPVKPTFQKMQRIVRDTAQAVKKEVSIILQGEDTELDKTVLEKINDPLVHLIRNSVDHGIESPEIRLEKGKPEKGTVTLRAFHRSGKLVIEVQDDGAGLDPNKLKKKAIEKGILKNDAGLTDKEAYNLIFAPGFSTKEQVTDVSGRGVGMDVVKTNITELSGEVQIESELGKGTTFRVILPLTLAIIDGMIVTFAEEKFVVPLNHVHETLRPQANQIQPASGIGEVLMLRGENMPLFRLGDFFNKRGSQKTQDMIALVIRTGNSPFAILVDDILGQLQVVIKQLGPELQGLKGVSGSTILGDGKPALILEPQDLLKRTRTALGPQLPKVVDPTVGGNAA